MQNANFFDEQVLPTFDVEDNIGWNTIQQDRTGKQTPNFIEFPNLRNLDTVMFSFPLASFKCSFLIVNAKCIQLIISLFSLLTLNNFLEISIFFPNEEKCSIITGCISNIFFILSTKSCIFRSILQDAHFKCVSNQRNRIRLKRWKTSLDRPKARYENFLARQF